MKYHFDDDRSYIRDWNIRIHIQFATGHNTSNNGQTIRNGQRDNCISQVDESDVLFIAVVLIYVMI